MVNELHACLLLRSEQSNVVGEDLIDATWRTPALPQAILDVHKAIFVSPDIPEAVNWRILQLRSLLKQSDLRDLAHKFDVREGYALSDLIPEMAKFFAPVIEGDINRSKVSFSGKPQRPAYELLQYFISSDGSTVKIQSPKYGTVEGSLGSAGSMTLPGTEARINLASFTGNFILRWAAKPTVTLTHISRDLAGTHRNVVEEVAILPSIFEKNTIRYLFNLAVDTKEPVAQILAAALLLAGSVASITRASLALETV